MPEFLKYQSHFKKKEPMNIETLQLLARYHFWATQRLSLSLQFVSKEDFFKDQKLFFKSIAGTLNHLLVADQLWLTRFTQGISLPLSLDQLLENDREPLMYQFVNNTKQWQAFIQTLDPQQLDQIFNYTTTQGYQVQVPYAATLMHVFNHATHHRGQITAALTQLDYSAPELDLIYMLIDEQRHADY